MSNTIRKLTSEPALIVLILTSLILFKLTFEKDIGTELITIYLTMEVLNLAVYILDNIGATNSEVRSVSGNSTESLLWAGGALVGFLALYGFVNYLFRQSVLPLSTANIIFTNSVYQSMFNSLVKFSTIDFSQLTIVKYYLFAVLIPLIETRLISKLFGVVGYFTNIAISNLRSPRTHGLIFTISVMFMLFHQKVRGVNNNLDLAMTFLFAYVSLLLVAHFKDVEAANEFHIGTNFLAIVKGG